LEVISVGGYGFMVISVRTYTYLRLYYGLIWVSSKWLEIIGVIWLKGYQFHKGFEE